MVEWWTKAHDLLLQHKILKSDIAKIVKESEVMLRDGVDVFFDQLYQSNIPLFIFSAGVGDILEEVLRQAQVFHPNVTVVSNYMDFDDKGVLRQFKEPLIHTFNKNNTVLEGTEPFRQLSRRPNILLLGDSLGDLSMADGVADVENILTVGFLNDRCCFHGAPGVVGVATGRAHYQLLTLPPSGGCSAGGRAKREVPGCLRHCAGEGRDAGRGQRDSMPRPQGDLTWEPGTLTPASADGAWDPAESISMPSGTSLTSPGLPPGYRHAPLFISPGIAGETCRLPQLPPPWLCRDQPRSGAGPGPAHDSPTSAFGWSRSASGLAGAADQGPDLG
ncbi:7-methylguanosine phosphate-specific 5'-nucleotidase isoform X3 [Pelodiscus sinensis]